MGTVRETLEKAEDLVVRAERMRIEEAEREKLEGGIR